jgi:ubiquinone/menaquinone biosynthesis C-methylase UbiE
MNSYKKLCTEFYDLDKPRAPEEALTFFLQYAEKANGPILEPMCGSGRFLIPMLEWGFDVDGSDASSHMLRACRERCRSKGLNPILYEQFLEHLDLPRQYSLVIIPAGSFCLITEQSQINESLKRIYQLMLPGARFVLEIERLMPPPTQTGQWSGRWVERSDGAKILISRLSHYYEVERVYRSIHRYELIKNGQLLEMEYEEFNLRLYDPAEFQALLEAHEFKEIKIFKAHQFRAPDEKDQSIIFECSKHCTN